MFDNSDPILKWNRVITIVTHWNGRPISNDISEKRWMPIPLFRTSYHVRLVLFIMEFYFVNYALSS